MDRQNRGNTGALKSTGLMRRRHVHPPCPPRPCGCGMYQPEWLTGMDRTMAVVTGGILAEAGEAIAFTDGCDTGNTVRLHGPGIYYAAYTLCLPEALPPESFCLHLNGQPLPESCTGGSAHAFAQAMFTVDSPAELQLVSRVPLALQGECACPLITLAVFRIG